MTTIACNPATGEMAGDTQLTTQRVKINSKKVLRLRDGGLFGYAGYAWQGRALFNWINSGMDGRRPSVANLEALVLDRNGKCWLVDCQWPPIPVHGPVAIGNGEQVAIAAMNYFKASPREAIKAAASVDSNTGCKVTCLRVRKKKAP